MVKPTKNPPTVKTVEVEIKDVAGNRVTFSVPENTPLVDIFNTLPKLNCRLVSIDGLNL